MKSFNKNDLEALLACISKAVKLYCPIRQYAAGTLDFVLNFDRWEPGAGVELSEKNTVLSPKGYFFRHHQDLYTTNVSGDIEITAAAHDSQPFVLFGVHACDLRGIEVLDGVFLDQPTDSFYRARREAATIVSLACPEKGRACFCDSFGINWTSPGGDVRICKAGDAFTWEPLTKKGETLTACVCEFLADDGAERQITYANGSKLPLPQGDLLEIFNSEKWESLSSTCIACGTCTFLCPTCQCYDIQEFGSRGRISCHRAWDSCMNEDFTKMAHGNPRSGHIQRFRQRFMHKLVYQRASLGNHGCVGCGRCTEKCPVSLSIQKVIKSL